MPLYEVAILELPTKKEVEEHGTPEKLVFGPKAVVAQDEQQAAISAVMDTTEDLKDIDRQRMQVLVRPFVSSD